MSIKHLFYFKMFTHHKQIFRLLLKISVCGRHPLRSCLFLAGSLTGPNNDTLWLTNTRSNIDYNSLINTFLNEHFYRFIDRKIEYCHWCAANTKALNKLKLTFTSSKSCLRLSLSQLLIQRERELASLCTEPSSISSCYDLLPLDGVDYLSVLALFCLYYAQTWYLSQIVLIKDFQIHPNIYWQFCKK